MFDNTSIAIIGGSLVGPLLSLLLARAGFRNVHVYEQTLASEPQAGGVIGLDPASLAILDSVGIHEKEVVPFASQRVVEIKIADRRELRRVDSFYPGRNSTWTLLHRALIARLPQGTLHAGKRLTGVHEGADGQAVLRFADGERVASGLVALADGRKSTGRKLLDPARGLKYAGYVAYFGELDWCPDDLGNFIRCEPPATQFDLAPIRLPDGRAGADWVFYLGTSAERFRERFGAGPTVRTFVGDAQMSASIRAEVNERVERLLTPRLAELVHRTTRWRAAPIVETAVPSTMVYRVGSSRFVLLGDALAPVRPETARGANAGIEQAAGLARALAEHRHDGTTLDEALTGWQQRHLPQVLDCVRRGPQATRALAVLTDK